MPATIRVLAIGLLIVLALSGLTPSQSLKHDRDYTKELAELHRRNHEATIADIEKEFGLTGPVDVRAPLLTDPMWWFIYFVEEVRIEVAAQPLEPTEWNWLERTRFRFVGWSWVGRKDGLNTRRTGPDGRASRTMEVESPQTQPARGPFADYLRNIDMTRPPTIGEIERQLGLGEPVDFQATSFYKPYLLFYQKNGYGITLHAEYIGPAGDSHDSKPSRARRNRDLLIFVGYWTVGEPSIGR